MNKIQDEINELTEKEDAISDLSVAADCTIMLDTTHASTEGQTE